MRAFENKKIATLYSHEEMQKRIREMGEQIAQDYEDVSGDLVFIGALKGSFIFLADLIRAVDLPLSVDFIGVSSYGDGTETSGKVKITHPLTKSIEGKHVIVVEDIVDTGLTMKALLDLFRESNPASLKVCTMLEKPERRQVEWPWITSVFRSQTNCTWLRLTSPGVFATSRSSESTRAKHRPFPMQGN